MARRYGTPRPFLRAPRQQSIAVFSLAPLRTPTGRCVTRRSPGASCPARRAWTRRSPSQRPWSLGRPLRPYVLHVLVGTPKNAQSRCDGAMATEPGAPHRRGEGPLCRGHLGRAVYKPLARRPCNALRNRVCARPKERSPQQLVDAIDRPRLEAKCDGRVDWDGRKRNLDVHDEVK